MDENIKQRIINDQRLEEIEEIQRKGKKMIKDGKLEEGEQTLQKALKLAKILHNDDPWCEITLIEIYSNLGDYHHENNGLDEAKPYYLEVSKLCDHLENAKDEQLADDCYDLAADLNYQFANLFYTDERYSEAIPLFSKALIFQKKVLKYKYEKFSNLIVKTLYKLGYSYWKTEKPENVKPAEQALLAHLTAIKHLFQKRKDKYHEGYAMALHNIGVFYNKHEQWINAKSYFEQAHKIFSEISNEDTDSIPILELEEKYLKEIEAKLTE